MISLKKFNIGKEQLDNRICIAPMCQYSSNNGNPSKWHYDHLGSLMKAGAGLLLIESTAVSKNGRISKKDLTLCNNNNFRKFKKLINYLKKFQIQKLVYSCLTLAEKVHPKYPGYVLTNRF